MKDTEQIRDHATEFFEDAEAMRLEDTLWWYVGRLCILKKYLERAKHEVSLPRILEVGCGSGGNLEILSKYGEVVGVERSEILANRARSRCFAKDVLVGDFFDIDISYDFTLICLFDVLEHTEDDDGFLKKLHKQVRPDHLLLLSVPACQFLYSQHDALLHHYRRYSRKNLEKLLQSNGYTILKGSYFVFFLFPVVAVSRLKEKVMLLLGRRQSTVKIGVVPNWLNWVLTRVLKLEATLSQIISFPIGVWLIVLAKKT
jgi:SAM-dependent methyltransferase